VLAQLFFKTGAASKLATAVSASLASTSATTIIL